MDSAYYTSIDNIIDGRYTILNQLSKKPSILCVKVQDIYTKLMYFCKVFLSNYQTNQEFSREYTINHLLLNEEHLVKALLMKTYREDKEPLKVQGHTIVNYAYILTPLHERGTYLDLLQAVNSRRLRLSSKTALYLWK